jgi:photosystem II stability/assembly factor-like uncharacterized protein
MSDPREHINRQAVLEAITQPPFEELRGRARQRRRRRSTVTVAALALVTAGFGVPVLAGQTGEEPSAGKVDTGPARSPTGWHFLDTRHGVVSYAEPAPSGEDGCRATVRVTDDGGRTWSGPRKAPCRPDGPGDPRQFVLMLDSHTILTFAPDGAYHISHDAGRTWRPHQVETGVADRIPVWTEVVHGCIDSTACRDPGQLRWYDPATGNRVQLRNGPDLERVLSTPSWGRDGSLWVPGRTSDGQYAVAVSRDQGRTWQTQPIGLKVDSRDDATSGLMVATRDGRRAYAVRDDMTLDNVLFRTVDGGRNWRRVTTDAEPHSPYNWLTGYVAADGTLVLETSGHAWPWQASRDDGRTVTALPDFPPFSQVFVVAGGYVRGSDQGREIHVSEDGLHWRKVKFP